MLSNQKLPLFNYFHQLFAQVTNPPIDAIREEIVTSTTVYLGRDGNILEEKPENCRVLRINNPILTNTDMLKIKNLNTENLKAAVVPITYYKNTSLEKAIDRISSRQNKFFRDGANILILSDRGVDENHVAIPSLLAVSAMQQHLVRTKKRTSVALVIESAEPREVHHFATLLGYGACAINPYLAIDTIKDMVDTHFLNKDFYAAVNDYNSAVLHGIVKIASKDGYFYGAVLSGVTDLRGSRTVRGICKEIFHEHGKPCRWYRN